MDELISRQAAIEALKRAEALTRAFGYHNVIETIRDLPTAEKKGTWLAGDKMMDYPSIPYKPWNIYCSCCREKAYNGDILFDYCPFCGAKMEN